MIAMPRPRLEIAERFIEHLVELGEHFDDLVVGIAVIGVDIVPRSMTAGPPNNGNVLAAEEIASRLHLTPILQLEGDMVHVRALAAHEIDGVMVGTATHEYEPVLNPIRHPETQNAAIEFGIVPGLRDDESKMPELDGANSGNRLRFANRRLGGEHLAYGALGIRERQHLRNPRGGIV